MEKIQINEQLVKHVAILAKINLDPQEVPNYVQFMKQIISYVETLDQVNTQNVEPMFSPVMDLEKIYQEHMESEFKTHEDQVHAFEASSQILRNAPKKEEGQYKIQAIIEEQ